MTYHIVMIDECQVGSLSIEDAVPVEVPVMNASEAWKEAKKFIGDATLTTFWGTWEGRRVLFLCHDMFTDDLRPNKQATLAYLGQCIPGTMHVIFGPVVGLLNKELW